MRIALVVTFSGLDRPGIVEMLSRTIVAHGANWEESQMARLAGRFAGILKTTVEGDRAESLARALTDLSAGGLQVMVDRGLADDERAFAGYRTLRLELTGTDREGIVRDISQALAQRGLNVDNLHSECVSAPMSGSPLFHARAELKCPANVTLEVVRRDLEQLADDLVVEIALSERSGD
jgi:glycine cleavage system regulatory protein